MSLPYAAYPARRVVGLLLVGRVTVERGQRLASRGGIRSAGPRNREDLSPPVAGVRDTARALGLVTVRKGRLTPTAAGTRCRLDPQALWQHIVGRLPLGPRTPNGRPPEWRSPWSAARDRRRSGAARSATCSSRSGGGAAETGTRRHPAHSPTLDTLDELAGAARTRWGHIEGVDVAVAATARAVIRRA